MHCVSGDMEYGGPYYAWCDFIDHFYVMLMWSLLYATYVQDMTRVSYHFVRGNNPKKFASTLVNFMGKVSLL
jgi:hypothetical protein